jgi:hypothetical protein
LPSSWQEYQTFNAPALLYQWDIQNPYNFSDQGIIFSDNTTSVWSGTVFMDWIAVGGNYVGLANYTNYNYTFGIPQFNISATPMTPSLSTAYTSLRDQWATLNPTGTPLSAYTSVPLAPSCPTSISFQTFNQNSPLPTLGLQALPNSLLSSSYSSSSSAPSPKSSPPTSSPSGGLSSEEKTAIGIVIPLVVIGVVMILFFLYKRKKMGRREKNNLDSHSFPELSSVPALRGS